MSVLAQESTAVGSPTLNIAIFLAFVAVTMALVVKASKTNKSAADMYTAGAAFSGRQNGVAISGAALMSFWVLTRFGFNFSEMLGRGAEAGASLEPGKAYGLNNTSKLNCVSTQNDMSAAPEMSSTALMIWTYVVPFMPPTST